MVTLYPDRCFVFKEKQNQLFCQNNIIPSLLNSYQENTEMENKASTYSQKSGKETEVNKFKITNQKYERNILSGVTFIQRSIAKHICHSEYKPCSRVYQSHTCLDKTNNFCEPYT